MCTRRVFSKHQVFYSCKVTGWNYQPELVRMHRQASLGRCERFTSIQNGNGRFNERHAIKATRPNKKHKFPPSFPQTPPEMR